MTAVNVQFSDSTNTTVVAIFGSAQDETVFPNQASIDDTDERYLAFVDPSSTLAGAKSARLTTLYAACAAAIAAGFTSDALGAAYNYPSALTDQSNQITVSNSSTGGLLWCESGSAWGLNKHTQAQAQAVVASFSAWLNQCQSQLATLSGQVSAATSVAAVQSVEWTTP